MEKVLDRTQFTPTKHLHQDRQNLLEKRLVCVNNQIEWLNKIKRTLEAQIFEEI
jgi:hypothetical protein